MKNEFQGLPEIVVMALLACRRFMDDYNPKYQAGAFKEGIEGRLKILSILKRDYGLANWVPGEHGKFIIEAISKMEAELKGFNTIAYD